MLLEILFVFALTLVNGVLAMSELAVVSSRTARLKVVADNGSSGAGIAMRLADRTARGLMVPRHEVELVDMTDDPAAVVTRFRDTDHSRLPVRDGGPDDIVGVVKSRDFLDAGTSGMGRNCAT